jgi:hypothetical protein
MAGMARKEVMQVRLSEEEKAQIAALARRAGRVPSEWMRLRSLSMERAVMPDRSAVEETSGNRVGSPSGREALEGTVVSNGRAPASPRPSIDHMQREGLVRPASSLAKGAVRPIPKGE